jgi:GNAT superfamily N-acetyltransferase
MIPGSLFAIRGTSMIRSLSSSDVDIIFKVVNDAAKAYKGIIPADRWKEPYMPMDELKEELEAGVRFFGWQEKDILIAVMGFQPVKDTTLIRHAYVITKYQRRGIGRKLLSYLMSLAKTPEVLVGTWEDATWAIRFYEKHGFKLVSPKEKDRLLRAYWNIPERQIETSVVLKFSRASRQGTLG